MIGKDKTLGNNENTMSKKQNTPAEDKTNQIDTDKMPVFFIVSIEDIRKIQDILVKGDNSLTDRLDDILRIRSIKLDGTSKEYIYTDAAGAKIDTLYPHVGRTIVTCPKGMHNGTQERAVFRVYLDSQTKAVFIALIGVFETHMKGRKVLTSYEKAFSSTVEIDWRTMLGSEEAKSDEEKAKSEQKEQLDEKKFIAVELSGDYTPLEVYFENTGTECTPENLFKILMDEKKYRAYGNKDDVEEKINIWHRVAELNNESEEVFNRLIDMLHPSQKSLDVYWKNIFKDISPDAKSQLYEDMDEGWEILGSQAQKSITYLCWRDANKEASEEEKKAFCQKIQLPEDENEVDSQEMESLEEVVLSEFRAIRENGLITNRLYPLYMSVSQIVQEAVEDCFPDEKNESNSREISKCKKEYSGSTENITFAIQLIDFLTKQGFIIRKEGDLVSSLCTIACIVDAKRAENLCECYKSISELYNYARTLDSDGRKQVRPAFGGIVVPRGNKEVINLLGNLIEHQYP